MKVAIVVVHGVGEVLSSLRESLTRINCSFTLYPLWKFPCVTAQDNDPVKDFYYRVQRNYVEIIYLDKNYKSNYSSHFSL